ncbi:autophagy-related protein 13a [Tanacetum coccineum]
MEYYYPNNEHQQGRHDQIVSQFLLKSLHIVLESRIPSFFNNHNNTKKKKSDKWFNLALGDRPSSFDSLNFWHRNLMEPMIIDILLVPSTSSSPLHETVVERWVVQYQRQPTTDSTSSSYKKTYKKSIILLRSLYTMLRLLPAYRAFRNLTTKAAAAACHFDINYKVSSFTSPFSRSEEQLMKQYTFLPVEAQNGRLSISVNYRETLSDFNLDTSSSFPTEIITDYVGSPATDPFRAFPILTDNNNNNRRMHPPQQQQQRPHSWSSARGPPPPFTQFGSPSPPAFRSSSGRYDLSSSPTDVVYGQRMRPPTTTHTSFYDYQLSPPFSPSPSPSPPTYLSGGNYLQSRLRSETSAPVTIPNNAMMSRSPRYLSPNNMSDPNRHSLPPPSPRSTRHELSSHESPSGIRSLKKSDMSRVGDLSSGSGSTNHFSAHKVSKDDSGRFSGLLSSSGSPSRVGFSRSSSRLSLQDELDDIDFSCPFIVDDVDTCDSPRSLQLGLSWDISNEIADMDDSRSANRNCIILMLNMHLSVYPCMNEVTEVLCVDVAFDSQSVGGKLGRELSSHAKKSQEAAVGALVRMLRTAPPLRQDSSCYSSHSMSDGLEAEFNTASGMFMSRKTSDALEELKAYRDIKHLILSKSGTPLVNKEDI